MLALSNIARVTRYHASPVLHATDASGAAGLAAAAALHGVFGFVYERVRILDLGVRGFDLRTRGVELHAATTDRTEKHRGFDNRKFTFSHPVKMCGLAAVGTDG